MLSLIAICDQFCNLRGVAQALSRGPEHGTMGPLRSIPCSNNLYRVFYPWAITSLLNITQASLRGEALPWISEWPKNAVPITAIYNCFSVAVIHFNPTLVLWCLLLNLNWLLIAKSVDSDLTGMVVLLAEYAESQAITGLILCMSALFLS